MHYQRWRKTGDPLKTVGTPHGLTAMERFMLHVEADPITGCMMWTAALRDGRYAYFSPEGRAGSHVSAHIWSYEQKHGPVPGGMILDHFECDRMACVHPDHVRPVTHRENTLRGDSPAARNLAKTHCDHGHEFTPANTYVWHGDRYCRACGRERQRRYQARKRALTHT